VNVGELELRGVSKEALVYGSTSGKAELALAGAIHRDSALVG